MSNGLPTPEIKPKIPEAARENREAAEVKASPEVSAAKEAAAETAEQAPPAPVPAVPKPAPAPSKEKYLLRVERVLEENLGDIYVGMSKADRLKFRAKGEETAQKLRGLIDSAKVKAKLVLNLIRDWLKLIPGVNKFFLEQEAKIKTDKILALAADRRREKEGQI